jgi:hypothetical protein
MRKLLSLLAALSLSGAALAQTLVNPNVQQVQLLAPQLLAFAGSDANFQSLVNGLTQGTPVTLTTLATDGTLQIVTFAPGTLLSATDTARILETARQSLISRGIAAPTGQQLATSLLGGSLTTALGTTPLTGLLSGNAGATAIQVRSERIGQPVPGGTTGLTAANLQAIAAGLARNTAVTVPGANGNVTFAAPGRPMSTFEINQALQLANVLLAQQGIVNPTTEQLRSALLGGTLGTAAGSVQLQGILQGQVRNTSDSPSFGTSDSRVAGTSNTPPTVAASPRALTIAPGATAAPTTPPAASAPAAGSVSPALTAPRLRR